MLPVGEHTLDGPCHGLAIRPAGSGSGLRQQSSMAQGVRGGTNTWHALPSPCGRRRHRPGQRCVGGNGAACGSGRTTDGLRGNASSGPPSVGPAARPKRRSRRRSTRLRAWRASHRYRLVLRPGGGAPDPRGGAESLSRRTSSSSRSWAAHAAMMAPGSPTCRRRAYDWAVSTTSDYWGSTKWRSRICAGTTRPASRSRTR